MTHAPPEVIFMFPQSGAAEAPKDQAMVRVVPRVPYENSPEEMTFCIQDVFRPGTHLPNNNEYSLHPFVLVPGE